MEQADSLRELLHRPRVFQVRLHHSIRLVDRPARGYIDPLDLNPILNRILNRSFNSPILFVYDSTILILFLRSFLILFLYFFSFLTA